MCTCRRVVGAGALLALLLALLLTPSVLGPRLAHADDEPAPAAPAPDDPKPDDPAPAPDEPDPPAPDDRKPPRPEARDVHKLYVPFRDLEKIFQKEGEGVFLPYEEFRRLWEAAHRLPPDRTTPPVPAVVRAAAYEGVVEGETIRFEARIEVEVLEKGWQRVPLDFNGIGVEKATIDGEPALLLPTAQGYDLLLEDPGRCTLDLVLRAAAPAQGDTHAASFRLPPVPLARLALRVPGRDTHVALEPHLASTTTTSGDATELLAFLGPVQQVRISWRRKVEDKPTVEPLVFAEETLEVRVDRGVVRSTLRAELAIRRAPIRSVQLAVPREAVVLYVNGDGIRTWTRSPEGDRLEVELRAPVTESYTLQVGLERALPPPPVAAVLPLAALDGLERERGFLRVRAADGVRIEPRLVPGLVQIDLQDLPEGLRDAEPGKAFAYRFPARPGEVVFDVQALEPRVAARQGTRVAVRPEALDLVCVAHVTVERAGIFTLDFTVPDGIEVTDVALSKAELDDWTLQREEDGPRLLRVSLRDRLLGEAVVVIHGRRALAISEEEGADPVALDVPVVRLRSAQHVRGFLGVHVDPALDHSQTGSEGLTPLDAGAPVAVQPPALAGEARQVPLVYRFEHREGDVALELDLKRKAPTITCGVGSWVRLEPGKTRMGATLRWHVAFRGVRTFRFQAPLELAERLHLEDPSLELTGPTKEMAPEDAPDDWVASHGIWTVRLPAPRTGAVVVGLVIDDRPEEELQSGGQRLATLPSFVPLEEDGSPLPNVTHDYAVRRDPLLEVQVLEVSGGEEIDARELPATLKDEGDFLAFRSHAPVHDVRLRVTKHDYEPVADIVVSHMHLDTVVPAEGRATTEAFLVVRNNDRQNMELKLPPGASIRALRVGDRSESPRVGSEGTVLVPLTSGLRKDQAFLVALFFDHDVERGGSLFETVRLVTPVPMGVQSDILTWRVIVPEDRIYTSFDGSVRLVDAKRSWAAEALAGLTSLVSRPDASTRLDVRRLIRSFESPFTDRVHKGRTFEFQGRAGTGEVEISSASPSFFLFWKLLWFAVAFVGARLLVRVARAAGVGAGAAFAVPALLLLALLIPAGPGATGVFTAMLIGVVLSGAVSLAGWYAAGRAEARQQAAAAREAEAAAEAEEVPEEAAEDAEDEDGDAKEGGGA